MDDLPLLPVTGWEVGAIPEYDAVFIRFEFLSNMLQAPAEADPGRRYVFQRAQLAEFRDAITRSLQKLESDGTQSPPGERH